MRKTKKKISFEQNNALIDIIQGKTLFTDPPSSRTHKLWRPAPKILHLGGNPNHKYLAMKGVNKYIIVLSFKRQVCFCDDFKAGNDQRQVAELHGGN